MGTSDHWNLTPPPGFQGLREDLPLNVYERNIPHWRQPGATYFVTFRLADSLPQSRLHEIGRLKEEWYAQNPPPRDRKRLEQLARMLFENVERWLDQGEGSCVLHREDFSKLVAESLKCFHNKRYELGASVVMPNHVHCIVRPLISSGIDLENIVGSWKSFTARAIHEAKSTSGPLWQEESYDRIVRDEEHLWRCLKYIGRNPLNANLSTEECRLWCNPEWELLGWTTKQEEHP